MAELLDTVRTIKRERDRLDAALFDAVKRAKSEGFSWSQIGDSLGTTRQAAQQTYGTGTRKGKN